VPNDNVSLEGMGKRDEKERGKKQRPSAEQSHVTGLAFLHQQVVAG